MVGHRLHEGILTARIELGWWNRRRLASLAGLLSAVAAWAMWVLSG
jgi:hypothetical protein